MYDDEIVSEDMIQVDIEEFNEIIEPEPEPELDRDVVNCPRYTCFIKLFI